jgi:hypothetical protein
MLSLLVCHFIFYIASIFAKRTLTTPPSIKAKFGFYLFFADVTADLSISKSAMFCISLSSYHAPAGSFQTRLSILIFSRYPALWPI